MALVAVLLVGVVPAGADGHAAELGEIVDPGAMADTELLEALKKAGVLHAWFEGTSHAQSTAMLRVEGDDRYTATRRDVIDQAGNLAEASSVHTQLAEQRRLRSMLSDELVTLITERWFDAQALAENDAAIKATDQAILKLLFARAASGSEYESAQQDLLASMQTLHSLRAATTTEIDELPIATIDAYVSAAEQLPTDCGVDWTLLAGIGRIESLHGTLDGSSVDSNANTWPHIFGPLLDGGATARQLAEEAEAADAEEEEQKEVPWYELSAAERYPDLFGPTEEEPASDDDDETDTEAELEANDDPDQEDEEEPEDEGNGFAVIADTDGGSLDGNPDWDRAIGPMQFIPGTWKLFDTDGNGDDWADPHNFYDAAASAATYLCHLESTKGTDPWTFIRGYNDSSSYVADVIETSSRLAAAYRLPSMSES